MNRFKYAAGQNPPAYRIGQILKLIKPIPETVEILEVLKHNKKSKSWQVIAAEKGRDTYPGWVKESKLLEQYEKV